MRVTPLAESSVPGTGFCSETRLGLLPGASTLPDNAMPCSISQMVPRIKPPPLRHRRTPGVPAGIVVSIEETRDEAKTRIRDETLEDDPEHDSAGHLLEDEHYAGLTYLGTLDKIRVNSKQGLGTGLQHVDLHRRCEWRTSRSPIQRRVHIPLKHGTGENTD